MYFISPILRSDVLIKKTIKKITNTTGSLGEREMLWEHESQASVSTAFSSSPKPPWITAILLFCSASSLLWRNVSTKKSTFQDNVVFVEKEKQYVTVTVTVTVSV